jgi:sortase A
MKPRVWADLLIAVGVVLLLAAGISATEPPEVVARTPTRPATRASRLSPPLPVVSVMETPTNTEAAAANPSLTAPTEPPATPPTPLSPTRPLNTAIRPTATRSSASPVSTVATPTTPRLEIPKIGLSAGISEVTWRVVETNDGPVGVWDTAETGVGHHRDSAQPGERGNVVLSGHSRGQGSFAQLAELAPGDEIWLTAEDGRSYRYRVSEMITVAEVGASLEERRAHARYMSPTEDARLTLITCWPPWAYTHRLIVIARPEG